MENNGGIPQPEGPFTPQTQVQAVPEGFDAGDVWVFPYTLKPYVNARGQVPPPTQPRIDRFQRAMAKLMLDYQRAAKEAEATEAKEAEGSEAEVTMEEVEEAIEERAQALSKVKDAVADLCNGHPTRNQLEGLPEYVFMRFADVLGRKVNPEV